MRRVPPALAAALLAASCLHAAEPSVSFDRRVELDGELQSACASAPEGYRRLTAREAKFLPPATCRPGDVPAEDVPFDARAQVLMRLGPPPELSARGIPDALTARIGPPAANARWLAALRSLARSTAAASAFEDETRSEEPAAAAFRARLARGAFVAAIEAYTGLALPGEHRVFLSPFHEAGGVANVVDDQPDGTVAVSSLLGPAVSASGDDYWTLRVPGTLWHEESHGVLDPLAVAWTERIERARPADAAAICYGDWRQCVREHVVRAVMIRLMERELGPAAAAEQLAFENPRRFRWLVPMIASLKEYEADRARWPTLADYYPRLLDAVRPETPDPLPTLRPDREPPPVRARLILLARTALPRMRDAAARAHLKRALELALEAEAPPAISTGSAAAPPPAAAGFEARAVTAFEAGRRAEALSLLDQALSLDPDDAEASLTRGVVLEALGRVPEALASYEAAVVSAGRRKDFPPHVLADAKESAARLKKR